MKVTHLNGIQPSLVPFPNVTYEHFCYDYTGAEARDGLFLLEFEYHCFSFRKVWLKEVYAGMSVASWLHKVVVLKHETRLVLFLLFDLSV